MAAGASSEVMAELRRKRKNWHNNPMPCPKCKGMTRVRDTLHPFVGEVQRVRICPVCKVILITIEYVSYMTPMTKLRHRIPPTRYYKPMSEEEIKTACNGTSH